MLTSLAGATFPRAARVLESEDFVRALKTRAQRGRFLWVYRRPPERSAVNDPHTAASPATAKLRVEPFLPQLGLMIGKRNAKTAVLRNAIKRRIREQFRVRQTRLPVSQYVVRLNVSVKTQDIAAVIAEWATTLDRYIEKSAAVTPHATPATTLTPVSTT